jgi:hypothetical protein
MSLNPDVPGFGPRYPPSVRRTWLGGDGPENLDAAKVHEVGLQNQNRFVFIYWGSVRFGSMQSLSLLLAEVHGGANHCGAMVCSFGNTLLVDFTRLPQLRAGEACPAQFASDGFSNRE